MMFVWLMKQAFEYMPTFKYALKHQEVKDLCETAEKHTRRFVNKIESCLQEEEKDNFIDLTAQVSDMMRKFAFASPEKKQMFFKVMDAVDKGEIEYVSDDEYARIKAENTETTVKKSA